VYQTLEAERRAYWLASVIPWHILMCIYAVGWVFPLDLGVRLYAAEAVAMVGLLFVNWASVAKSYPLLRSVLMAYVVWIVAIALSDFINDVALFDFARNVATPILGSVSLVFVLSILYRVPSSFLTFLAATALSKAILGEPAYGDSFADQAFTWASVEADTNFFKVRIDPFLTPVILLFACVLHRNGPSRTIILFLVASIGYFAIDARSTGLMFLLSSLILAGTAGTVRPKAGQILASGFAAVIVAYLFYATYVAYVTSFNPDGHSGVQLAILDNPFNPFNLLIGGRSEWTVLPSAVSERPLFGWGSWAEDPDGRFSLMRLASSYSNSVEMSLSTYIPVHSVIGAAWIWSGALGLVAMLMLLRAFWRLSMSLLGMHSLLYPAAVFYMLAIYWHYLFSPPQIVRLLFPVALALLLQSSRALYSVRK
jgi:hypothetical protein